MLANGLMLREIHKAYPNATRREQMYELSRAWNSGGLSLMTLPKAESEPKVRKVKNFQIEEEDTPS